MKRLAIHSYPGEVALAMVLMTAAMVVVLWVADAVGQTTAAGSEVARDAGAPPERDGGAAFPPREPVAARARLAYLEALMLASPRRSAEGVLRVAPAEVRTRSREDAAIASGPEHRP